MKHKLNWVKSKNSTIIRPSYRRLPNESGNPFPWVKISREINGCSAPTSACIFHRNFCPAIFCNHSIRVSQSNKGLPLTHTYCSSPPSPTIRQCTIIPTTSERKIFKQFPQLLYLTLIPIVTLFQLISS